MVTVVAMAVGGADFLAGMAVEDPYPCQRAAFRAKILAVGHAGGVLLSGNLRQFPDPRQAILC
jgi:hypothetical protein